MAVKKHWLGKVQKDVGGYKVRMTGGSRTTRKGDGTESTHFQPDGKFAVYAGRKKLVKNGFTSVDEAVAFAQTL
jgi:hypothetical protein